jgi:hypothetical protein
MPAPKSSPAGTSGAPAAVVAVASDSSEAANHRFVAVLI